MKKIKLHISVSLDGYIARIDGDLDWLAKFHLPNVNHDFLESIDTIIMGNIAYQELCTIRVDWPFKDKSTYVLTRYKKNLPPKENVNYLINDIVPTIQELKKQDGKDIWVIGGGQVITLLLNHDLIDEMQICYIPIILGNGISLFPNEPKESKWMLTKSIVYNTDILKVDYRKKG